MNVFQIPHACTRACIRTTADLHQNHGVPVQLYNMHDLKMKGTKNVWPNVLTVNQLNLTAVKISCLKRQAYLAQENLAF